jgi:glycogen(starch) synthase
METSHLKHSLATRGAENPSMNICLISEEFPPGTGVGMGGGGIGTYAYNLARGLTELGHRVHVVVRGWGNETVHKVGDALVHHVSIPEPSWRRGTYFFNARFGETREILLWNLRVAQVVRQINAVEPLDVIESPEYHAQGLFTALSQRHIPMVVKLHTPAYLLSRVTGTSAGWSQWDTLLSEHLEYRLVRRARAVTSPSRKMAEDAAKQWSLDASAIHVIPNMIDEDLFHPINGANVGDQTLLCVGQVARHKGVETLVEALPTILDAFPKVRVRLVGKVDPSEPGASSRSDHLHQRLQEVGVAREAVEFLGPVDRTALPVLYTRAAVCVVPSLWESFGYSCLEAMACGCAVVASAVGGLPEIVTDQVDGLLVPPGRPEALAAAIIHLLSDPLKRRRLGDRARETVRNRFSLGETCAETARLYRYLLG